MGGREVEVESEKRKGLCLSAFLYNQVYGRNQGKGKNMAKDEAYSLAEKRIDAAIKENQEELNLRNQNLTKLPESIGFATNLKKLDISNNNIVELPDSISQLTALQELTLSGNKFTELPDALWELTQLQTLNLSKNKLIALPESIGQLTELFELNLLENFNLEGLPKSIGQLEQLRILDLGGGYLKTLPKSFENLMRLKILKLNSQEFEILPEYLTRFTTLEVLWLNFNQLSMLPEAIGNLTNLTELALPSNQLTTLPESIQNLTNLKTLNLKDNKFEVGAEVYELPPQEQIQEILKWQRAQEAGTLQPIHEAKVIFVGESNYGKTHLIEMLREGKIDREITTTHGIERSQINIPYEKKDIRLNIWDLGGQEFMRSTHQFFFSERTLYILVTLARRERNELNHWLKLANQLGNAAPVLVVINKIDLDPHDLDRKSLERDYPNIVGFVRTSINDCDDGKAEEMIEQLREKIIATVSNKELMPSVFEQRPLDWFAVKEQLEKLEADGTDFITYETYEKLDFIKDLSEEERKVNLKLLSMIGAVVSFVDDPRLIDTNVINPQWIMDGVYAIINDSHVKDEAKGELHIKDLARVLPKDKFPKARHAYLLELMQKFNLCYAANGKRDVYFIPDLFEDVEPDFDWDGDSSMHFRYFYDDFPPDTFMTRFIVEISQDIIDEKRWRSGVYISNGNCQAKVYQTYRKNYIHIEVTCDKGQGRSYLYAIRETFRKLHHPYPKMKIKQEILYKDHWLDYETLSKFEEKNRPFYHIELDEDVPVTSVLNGYSTTMDRKGNQRRIKIFLASSSELKEERDQFEIFINRENKELYEQGIFLDLIVWEDFIDAMSQTRLQNEYNLAVKDADIFVSLFFTKVGKFTLEEFKTAFKEFKKTGKPYVYTYFKDAPINAGSLNRQDANSLFDFQELLKRRGHYQTMYKNIEDLKYQFKKQLVKILPTL